MALPFFNFAPISRLCAFQTVVTITGTGCLHPSGCRGSALTVLQTVTLDHWQRPFPWLAAAARDRGAAHGTRRSGCCPCPLPDAPAVAAGAGAGSQSPKWQRRWASGAHLHVPRRLAKPPAASSFSSSVQQGRRQRWVAGRQRTPVLRRGGDLSEL